MYNADCPLNNYSNQYMQRIYKKELADVHKFMMGNKKVLFEEFQETVKKELKSIFFKPALSNLSPDIFSREDIDPRQKIKSDSKIALKLYKWNTYNKIKKNKLSSPKDIHDIVGITIACNYPTDTNRIKQFLDKKFESNYFKVKEIRYLDPNESGGYRAYHCTVLGLGNFRSLLCEIQIKTRLTLSWGAKTHDLTYKPLGEIDDKLTMHMEKLAHIAQSLDDQSEILKDLIYEAWLMDETRRDAARESMLSQIQQINSDPQIEKIIQYINDNKDELSIEDIFIGAPAKFSGLFHTYLDDKGHSLECCRLISLFALNRATSDQNEWAVDVIDSYIASLDNKTQDYDLAVMFRSVACMALGEYEEAIVAARLLYKRVTEKKNPEHIVAAQSNLAYILSEAYLHKAFDETGGQGERITSVNKQCAEEALLLASELVKIQNNENIDKDTLASCLDTAGAVLITCGKSEQVVRTGLEYCTTAKEFHKGDADSVSEQFFSLHEKRAFKRILSFK